MSEKAIKINQPAQGPDQFKHQMQAFASWKNELIKTINGYQQWLKKYDKGTPEIELRLFDALQSLQHDTLSIAFVAEFSRGKTELINAIFFADAGRRLLPSDVGRTTMCPTELLYDTAQSQAYLKMLPIETRLSDMSLAELKAQATQWTMLPVDISSPDKMAEIFKEVVKTKLVSSAEAEKLGLLTDDVQTSLQQNAGGSAQVEVPVWRHAIISFPHPLLQQGLVILDTPGLNALGSEPELTLNMLPSAQAVLFILSADTGVTRSDLDIWQNHIMAFRNKKQSGLIAVLNKIDTLWDEMKTETEVQASITEQCRTSAALLGIDAGNVFPISAQKALLAKIRNNDDLLKKSNLPALENLLAMEILPTKQKMIWDSIVTRLDQMIASNLSPLQSRAEDIKRQLDDMELLRNSNDETLQKMIHKAKTNKVSYYESVKNFQASRRKIALQAKNMFDVLGEEAIDTLIKKTRTDMQGSWTTAGLKKGMQAFFDSARDAMQIANRQAEQTHKSVESIYKKFQEDHGLHLKVPEPLNVGEFNDQLQQIYAKAEGYRDSTLTTMTEQNFVIKKFFISLVSHVRSLFVDAQRSADQWFKDLVTPLVNEIQEKRDSIEQHMETLNRISSSKTELDGKVASIKQQHEDLLLQTEALQAMRDSLQRCTPP
ncbi:MAG: dynamin family protein [Gammaproteobacteria bacterium]|nr:dynamin family protein [Gammaproteobacteria bacterium]